MIFSPLPEWIGKKTGLGEAVTPGALQDWQFARLRATLARVLRHSAYYGETLQGI